MKKRDELLKVLLATFGSNLHALPSKAVPLAFHTVCDPETPAEILELLAQCDHHVILERIAEHPNVKMFLLEILSSHSHPDVRAAVADNPNVSLDILLKLRNDDHPDVRYRLAENPYIPRAILVELKDDSNPYVAHRANTTLNRLEPREGRLRSFVNMIGNRIANRQAAG